MYKHGDWAILKNTLKMLILNTKGSVSIIIQIN